MARINLTLILTWLTLTVSALIAFGIGWYQWQRYTTAQREKEQTSRNIALQERNTRDLRSQFKNVTKQIASPDALREDPEFYGQLKRLMDVSGVRPISIQPTAPVALPTIGTSQTGGKPNANGPTDTKKDDDKKDGVKAGYSLANLPMNVRPLTSNVTVAGSFQNINLFIRNIYNFRFSGGGLRYGAPRAININSLQINGADAAGSLHATMMLTRFVYKPDAAPAPPPAK